MLPILFKMWEKKISFIKYPRNPFTYEKDTTGICAKVYLLSSHKGYSSEQAELLYPIVPSYACLITLFFF